MWMFEVELSDSQRLQAYKHIDTRRYIHLDAGGGAFAYESRERYRSVPIVDVLGEVFAPLPGFAGVSDEQIRASWRAVDRLQGREDDLGPAHSC